MRTVLPPEKISSPAQGAMSAFHKNVVDEVSQAVARDSVVIVGMKTNAFVKKARKFLDAKGVKYTYLEYGGYTSKWQERLAIKLWSGWPTFPQVFMDGKLIGGCRELMKHMS